MAQKVKSNGLAWEGDGNGARPLGSQRKRGQLEATGCQDQGQKGDAVTPEITFVSSLARASLVNGYVSGACNVVSREGFPMNLGQN